MTDLVAPHKPVLVSQVLTYLDPKPGQTYLDVTFGSGGHTRAILEKEPTCRVIALDWDETALERFGVPLQEEFGDRLTLLWGNFALLYKVLKKAGIEHVDGILADFGTSQVQLAHKPGFSFNRDTVLDMRMSPPHQVVTAADVLRKSSEEKLREIFRQLGEERYAKQIAHAIVEERKKRHIRTTKQLADLVERIVPREFRRTHKMHPATRVFQALRMYVNKELQNIEGFLATAVQILNPHGRLVCISFHSLEDRIVKQFFMEREMLGTCTILTSKVVRAQPEELAENPSARSACLRAVQVIGKEE